MAMQAEREAMQAEWKKGEARHGETEGRTADPGSYWRLRCISTCMSYMVAAYP